MVDCMAEKEKRNGSSLVADKFAILHFNENSDREHAKLQDGTEQVNIVFPKYKKGEYTVKKILVKCTYRYVDDLKENVVRILEGIETAVLERAAAPRSLVRF
ncbi:hypothetical protein OS493_000703 [Desmophyllum pertusum]|uniref:Uncharacterized protein n=1 Tax=Desmophyllum pertusum TaxID=174260 RepID=A0A9X0A7Y4_9CNID|nr:hypothetical protein OS493_000703 [Desmophyllum pertusum]